MLTLKGYAEATYRWFSQQPKLSFQPFEKRLRGINEQDATSSHRHVIRSSCHSIEKSRQRLGVTVHAIQQAVKVLIDQGETATLSSK